jgi:hypothetical protein
MTGQDELSVAKTHNAKRHAVIFITHKDPHFPSIPKLPGSMIFAHSNVGLATKQLKKRYGRWSFSPQLIGRRIVARGSRKEIGYENRSIYGFGPIKAQKVAGHENAASLLNDLPVCSLRKNIVFGSVRGSKDMDDSSRRCEVAKILIYKFSPPIGNNLFNRGIMKVFHNGKNFLELGKCVQFILEKANNFKGRVLVNTCQEVFETRNRCRFDRANQVNVKLVKWKCSWREMT